MSDNPDFAKAREQQHAWKHAEIQRAAVAIVQAGLAELTAGRGHFGPDNIPESITFDGQGIVGSAVHMLRAANVIRDCWLHRPTEGIVHGRRASKRPSANGRKIALYQLTSRAMAEAYLARNGLPQAPLQIEMAL